MKNYFLLLITSIIIAGCSAAPIGTTYFSLEELHEKVDEKFNDTLFNHAHWGAYIQSLNSGEVWYERNADKMFMPASNEKILTSSAALTKLGTDFKFTTKLLHTGLIIDSILVGDLIVIGDGDPTLYTKFFDKPTTVFETWADSLISLGIKKIDGNIIGDDNNFDDRHIGYGWAFDGLDAWYSAEVGALQINENYVDLNIIPPDSINKKVKVIPNLNSSYFMIKNNLTAVDTGRTRVSINRPYGTNTLILTGEVLAGSDSFERTPSLTNPTLFYVTVLKEVLNEKGIEVTGSPIDCDDILDFSKDSLAAADLIVHHSPKLIDILEGLMKRSQNMYAETMVRTLGYQFEGLGSFWNGRKVIEETLAEFGLTPGTYAFMDGSGLSRYNFVSPNQIAKILIGMWKSEYRDEWYDIQPIAGVDGTLRRRMKSTKAEGNVHAKTGTISNVRGLSGYVKTSGGKI